jgi:hypothetical protein
MKVKGPTASSSDAVAAAAADAPARIGTTTAAAPAAHLVARLIAAPSLDVG